MNTYQPIWIFRHIDCEGPGYFAKVLARYGLEYRLFAIDQGDAVPTSINGAAALVFMGGPMSANDSEPWLQQELELIRLAVAAQRPLLGHCLGGQLISKALGAKISANPVREIGWHPVYGNPDPAAQMWLQHLDLPAEVFHWHGETFALPDDALLLLRSEFCAHQAYVLHQNILAFQCHIEMLPPMVTEWAEKYADEIRTPINSVQSAADMVTDLTQRIGNAQRIADQLYSRWLQQSGLIANNSY